MRFTNYTDIASETLKEFVRFSKPNISNFDVQIKNCGGTAIKGRAYAKGCSYHSTSNPFLNVYVGRKKAKYPKKTYDGKGYIGFKVFSQLEEILFVIAHELRHLWQGKIKRGYRIWGARGQFSERDADAYGIRIVRKWRKEHGII